MASKALGDLTAATALSGAEEIYTVQSGNSRKTTAQAIADLGTSQDNMSDGTTNKNYTATEQTKLAGIETGAEVNVSPDWDATTGDGAILNKPTLREVLTANRTYYVRTDGNDANDGLTNTAGGAFKTVQQAVNVALALDMSIYSVAISVGAGTFDEGAALSVAGNGNARITISGAGYDQTTISGLVQATFGVALTLKDVDIVGTTVGIWARYGAQISFAGTVQLSGGTARLVGVDLDAIVNMNNATLRINADSSYFLYATNGGHMIFANGATFKTTAARSFSGATVLAAQTSTISFTASQVTWDVLDGAVAGKRYIAGTNAVIDTVTGGGSTFIPGSVDGTTATGGQYA